MTERVMLPGSVSGMEDEEFVVGEERPTGTRFTAEERDALLEMARWWRNRRDRDDDADPIETMFGGVDIIAEVQSVGTPIVYAALLKPLVGNQGASFWVQAFGVPTNFESTGNAYTVVGICHFRRVASGSYISHYGTIGRAPSTIACEIRSGVTGTFPNHTPVIGITGVSGETIDWKLEMYRLEIAN